MSAMGKEEIRKAEEKLLTSEARQLWQSIEEKNLPSAELHRQRAQEFQVLPKDSQPEEVSRRDFFKWMGAASALFATACQQRPSRDLVPYVHRPHGLVYGKPVWFSSVGPKGLGVLVKTREGRPIKLEGNPDHELNQGGLDAQSQSEILNLYNPERLTHPLAPKSGEKLSWDEASSRVFKALRSARSGGVRLLTAPVQSPSLQSAIDSFKTKYSAAHETFSAINYSPIGRAHEIVMGSRRIPYFNFEKADVVVSVDADFLGTWLRPVDFTKQFSKRRRIHEDENINVNQLFSFESSMTITGIAADYRFPIKPSQQLRVLLTLLNELSGRLQFDSSIKARASGFSAEALADELGVEVDNIKKLVDALLNARGKSLVVAGASGPQALELQLACIALNEALGNYGETVVWERSIRELASSPVVFDQWVSDALRGDIDVLILQGVNPAYSRENSDFAQALAKIPFVVSIGYELDETARLADLAIGESHFLESWGDNESVEGYFSIQQPTIEPLFQTKSFGELLLEWSEYANVDYRLFVQDFWKKRSNSSNFTAWWQEKLKTGFWKATPTLSRTNSRWSGAAALIENAVEEKSNVGMELVTYPSIPMGDGVHANNAWRQELPDPVTKVTWGNFAAVSPDFAKEHSLKRGSVVRVQSGTQQIELPVFVQPGLRKEVVAVALGYGRKFAGSIGSNVGVNAFKFAEKSPAGEWKLSGLSVDVAPTGGFKELACTQDEFQLHGRDYDILQQTTLDAFRKDPKAAKGGHKILDFSIYGDNRFVYPGHKWGMAIDLNKCTGCQACVVACYSENNIAIVGEDQVKKGRHLAWLRLDLYYQGESSTPEANFEPMLCQQCERAPCETVCPVLATVHSSDGLNDMVYNRCVGTRYCANNCPYKVRRFNYFYYSDKLANKIEVSEESPLSLMLNPDVTVRSRGVMEKCTFCVQRIRKGVDEFKADGVKELPEGAIKTACQQSCPADAISFGDLNNPQHQVSKMAEKAQAFKVLEVLNTKPSISYLPRVRNKG